MTKENILFGIIGLLVGLIISFVATNSYNRSNLSPTNQPPKIQTSSPQSEESVPQAAVPAVAEALGKADSEPDNFDAQMNAGEMFARISNYEKAIPYYEKAQKIKPNEFMVLVKLGNMNFDQKNLVEAQKWYEKALEIKPDDVSTRTDLGITFIERENPDYERAIKEFDTSLKTNPNHEPTLYNMAIAYFKKGDTEKAQEFKGKLGNPKLVERLDKMFSEK